MSDAQVRPREGRGARCLLQEFCDGSTLLQRRVNGIANGSSCCDAL
jgi:hypothetical protein